MSRFLPTFLAALLALVLLGKGVWGVSQLTREPDLSFYGPGEYRLIAPVASDFTVWYEPTSVIDGTYSVQDQRLPAGTAIVVVHAGVVVPAKVNGGSHTSGNSGDKSSVLSFTASEPGDYLIKVSGLEERRSFVVTRGNGLGPIFAVVCWFIGAGFGFLIFLMFLILCLAKAFPKQAKSSAFGK